jgi:hypothetical protein
MNPASSSSLTPKSQPKTIKKIEYYNCHKEDADKKAENCDNRKKSV